MSIKDKIIVSSDLSTIRIPRTCTEKYARKILQDYLKNNYFPYYGWELWITNRDEDSTDYEFEMFNKFAVLV